MVEHVLEGRCHMGEIPTRRVHDALGLASRTRGVEQEEQLLSIHRLCRTLGFCATDELVIPVVSPVGH